MRPLVRIGIPNWMRSNMLLKEASFDIPATEDGHHFLNWWDGAPLKEKHSVIKIACDKDTNLVEALKSYLAEKATPELG